MSSDRCSAPSSPGGMAGIMPVHSVALWVVSVE